MSYLYLPFILQSLLMAWDEHLHQRRGLGTWERLGHPLDTITVLVPFTLIALLDFSERLQSVYIGLAVFSCLFITKDEFVHAQECEALENWIHAVLFVLHPLIFLSSGVLWKYDPENRFLCFQSIALSVFLIYQILRWSIPWKQLQQK